MQHSCGNRKVSTKEPDWLNKSFKRIRTSQAHSATFLFVLILLNQTTLVDNFWQSLDIDLVKNITMISMETNIKRKFKMTHYDAFFFTFLWLTAKMSIFRKGVLICGFGPRPFVTDLFVALIITTEKALVRNIPRAQWLARKWTQIELWPQKSAELDFSFIPWGIF